MEQRLASRASIEPSELVSSSRCQMPFITRWTSLPSGPNIQSSAPPTMEELPQRLEAALKEIEAKDALIEQLRTRCSHFAKQINDWKHKCEKLDAVVPLDGKFKKSVAWLEKNLKLKHF